MDVVRGTLITPRQILSEFPESDVDSQEELDNLVLFKNKLHELQELYINRSEINKQISDITKKGFPNSDKLTKLKNRRIIILNDINKGEQILTNLQNLDTNQRLIQIGFDRITKKEKEERERVAAKYKKEREEKQKEFETELRNKVKELQIVRAKFDKLSNSVFIINSTNTFDMKDVDKEQLDKYNYYYHELVIETNRFYNCQERLKEGNYIYDNETLKKMLIGHLININKTQELLSLYEYNPAINKIITNEKNRIIDIKDKKQYVDNYYDEDLKLRYACKIAKEVTDEIKEANNKNKTYNDLSKNSNENLVDKIEDVVGCFWFFAGLSFFFSFFLENIYISITLLYIAISSVIFVKLSEKSPKPKKLKSAIFKIVIFVLILTFLLFSLHTCTSSKYNNDDYYGNSYSTTVYITNTGSKYHHSYCSYLDESCISISLSSAEAQGYEPCSVCH